MQGYGKRKSLVGMPRPKKAKVQDAENVSQNAATAQRIDQNVRNATTQVAASRLAVDLARKAAEAADRNLDLVADNYTLGRVDIVDLIDAQTNALTSHLAAVDAVNDYLLDLMRVERAVGRFMFFVAAEDRERWIEELEQYARAEGLAR